MGTMSTSGIFWFISNSKDFCSVVINIRLIDGCPLQLKYCTFYIYVHPLWILAPPVDATTCADDATACDANGNGATACVNGVCVGK